MTLQQFVDELSEDLRIKFTQLEQILAEGIEKCQEIRGICAPYVEEELIGKYLDVNHVKKWSYYRITEVNDGKKEQVEWIGSVDNKDCQEVADEWQERKDKTKKFYKPLRKAEVIEGILERILRGIGIKDYTKSEPQMCSFKGVICTWCRGGKCIIQNDKPIQDVEECFL